MTLNCTAKIDRLAPHSIHKMDRQYVITRKVDVSRRPCMFRQTDLKRALKGAVSAGVKISHVELRPDGVIVLVPGKQMSQADDDLDEELAEFEVSHGQG